MEILLLVRKSTQVHKKIKGLLPLCQFQAPSSIVAYLEELDQGITTFVCITTECVFSCTDFDSRKIGEIYNREEYFKRDFSCGEKRRRGQKPFLHVKNDFSKPESPTDKCQFHANQNSLFFCHSRWNTSTRT